MAQTTGPIDQNDINSWSKRLNEEIATLGTELGAAGESGAQPWRSSLFGCFNPIDLCLTTWCLPCVTFGKTHHRTQKEASMANYSAVNTSCLLFGGTCCLGLSWIPAWMQRADIRRKYHLEGNCLMDLLLSCCCGCCTLIQQEKETELLVSKEVQHQAYQSDGPMRYGK